MVGGELMRMCTSLRAGVRAPSRRSCGWWCRARSSRRRPRPACPEHVALGVELHLDPEVADGVARLDEGAADVVVADQPHLERHAGFFGEAERRRHAGVGHRDHDVGLDRLLARELPAELLAHLVDVASEDAAVGAREVDVLEDAAGARRGRERPEALDALRRSPRAPRRARSRARTRASMRSRAQVSDATTTASLMRPEHQRPEPVGVARRDQLVAASERPASRRRAPAEALDRRDPRALAARRRRSDE